MPIANDRFRKGAYCEKHCVQDPCLQGHARHMNVRKLFATITSTFSNQNTHHKDEFVAAC